MHDRSDTLWWLAGDGFRGAVSAAGFLVHFALAFTMRHNEGNSTYRENFVTLALSQ